MYIRSHFVHVCVAMTRIAARNHELRLGTLIYTACPYSLAPQGGPGLDLEEIPGGSRGVPGGSRGFQGVPGGSRGFQGVPEGPSDMILKGLGLQRGYFLGGRGQKQTLIKMRIHFLSKKNTCGARRQPYYTAQHI